QKVDLSGAQSWSEALRRIEDYAKAHPGTGWILGRGWDQNRWPDNANPTNDSLNILFPERPVLLQRVDGHAAVVNQKALDSAQLTAESTIAGGLLAKKDGKLTGLLLDNAVSVFQQIFEDVDEPTKRQALLDAQKDCFAVGLTMVCDAGLDAGTIDLMKRMQEELGRAL